MAAGLTTWTARRRWAGLALVVGVAILHACVADQWAEQAQRFSLREPAFERLKAVYTRELELSVAPAARAVTAKPAGPALPPARPRPLSRNTAAAPVAPAASQPEPPMSEAPRASAAEEPAREPEAEVTTAAASAPVPPPSFALSPELPPLPPATPTQASAEPSPEAFEWPGSTRLRYNLSGYYQGEIHGQAQVEWIRVGHHYQVHLDVSVGLSFAPLMARRMSSDGDITPMGLAPRRYEQETKFAFKDPWRAVMFFEPDAIVMANGQRRERWPGVQDTASQFVQLSWMFETKPELLRRGNVVVIPLAMPRAISHWVYDVLDEETLYTPFGEVNAVHLKPRREARAGGDLVSEIWVAPRLRHLPVRFRIRQDADNFIDLMLDRKPELADPQAAAPEEPPSRSNPP